MFMFTSNPSELRCAHFQFHLLRKCFNFIQFVSFLTCSIGLKNRNEQPRSRSHSLQQYSDNGRCECTFFTSAFTFILSLNEINIRMCEMREHFKKMLTPIYCFERCGMVLLPPSLLLFGMLLLVSLPLNSVESAPNYVQFNGSH